MTYDNLDKTGKQRQWGLIVFICGGGWRSFWLSVTPINQIRYFFLDDLFCWLISRFIAFISHADAQRSGGWAEVHAAEETELGDGARHICLLRLWSGHAVIEAATGLLLFECRTRALLSVYQVVECISERQSHQSTRWVRGGRERRGSKSVTEFAISYF